VDWPYIRQETAKRTNKRKRVGEYVVKIILYFIATILCRIYDKNVIKIAVSTAICFVLWAHSGRATCDLSSVPATKWTVPKMTHIAGQQQKEKARFCNV
jgi:hypothetical protein